jgi:hypothetical protein
MRIREILQESNLTKPFRVGNAGDKGRGLFATAPIPAGTLLIKDRVVPITDDDWLKIKDTRFARMYGLRWRGNTHAVPVGDIEYQFSSPQEQQALLSTQIFRNGVRISPFLLVNHSKTPKSHQEFGDNYVALRTVAFIEPGQEIEKNYDVQSQNFLPPGF